MTETQFRQAFLLLLIAAIAARTSRIRVGSGGVMLPHYSPLKVAETFSMLSGLLPDRVELMAVVDRAEIPTAQALQTIAPDGPPSPEQLATAADPSTPMVEGLDRGLRLVAVGAAIGRGHARPPPVLPHGSAALRGRLGVGLQERVQQMGRVDLPVPVAQRGGEGVGDLLHGLLRVAGRHLLVEGDPQPRPVVRRGQRLERVREPAVHGRRHEVLAGHRELATLPALAEPHQRGQQGTQGVLATRCRQEIGAEWLDDSTYRRQGGAAVVNRE